MQEILEARDALIHIPLGSADIIFWRKGSINLHHPDHFGMCWILQNLGARQTACCLFRRNGQRQKRRDAIEQLGTHRQGQILNGIHKR
ncbi:hypothetical protein NBRC106471_2816 [Acetobacter pasteurianus subsp. pasteurianus LMG 1262 = NBRC 106471]|nr:hypothetical protein NBRC106471_2816 [Acetobacter pasteurianus subsp. pasteurianus LMG 1262 = NBRC 106471]